MSESALLLLVDSTPRVRFAEAFPATSFRVFGQDFEEAAFGRSGEVGFVDWIRSRPEHIIGVRLWLHSAWVPLMAYVRESDRIRILTEGVFELFFREGEAAPELSCDQAFDETRAYLSGGQQLLLALSAASLSDVELEDVRELSGSSSG